MGIGEGSIINPITKNEEKTDEKTKTRGWVGREVGVSVENDFL